MAWPHTFGNQTQANGSWLDDNFNAAFQNGDAYSSGTFSVDGSSGNVITVACSSIEPFSVREDGSIGTGVSLLDLQTYRTSSNFLIFVFGSGNAIVGSINSNGSSTAFNTTSDAALKSVHGAADGSPLSALPVRDCTFTSEGSVATPRPMILAQECKAIAPWAVTAGSADGKTPCMIDYSKLVAPLIAYAQALEARIEALEAKAAVPGPAASAGLVAARSALASAAALPVVQAAIARGVALKGAPNGSPQAQTL